MGSNKNINVAFVLTAIAVCYVQFGNCKSISSNKCSFYNQTTAGLSSAYAAETIAESRRFPDISKQRSRRKINGTPWWGNDRREASTKKCFVDLKTKMRTRLRWRLFRRFRIGRSTDNSMANMNCFARNTATGDEVYRVCGECVKTTDLGVEIFPRYLNEMVCDPRNSADAFSGEGVCVQKSIQINVKREFANGTSSEEEVSFGTGCEFRMYHGSVLMTLNTEM